MQYEGQAPKSDKYILVVLRKTEFVLCTLQTKSINFILGRLAHCLGDVLVFAGKKTHTQQI